MNVYELADLIDEAIRPRMKECDHEFTEDNGEAYCARCEYRQVLQPDEYIDVMGEIMTSTTEEYDRYMEGI